MGPDLSSLEDLGEDPAFTEQEVPSRGGADSAGLDSSQAKSDLAGSSVSETGALTTSTPSGLDPTHPGALQESEPPPFLTIDSSCFP